MYDRHMLYILALMTSLGLYVMEEGCLAAPEASVSEEEDVVEVVTSVSTQLSTHYIAPDNLAHL